jgi:ketosteroid isomerase-like protein
MAESDDERDIMQCDDRRFKAMVRGDVAALRMALSEHVTYTHSSGAHDTKAQFLASLTLGQLSYRSIIPEARSVRVYGGAGIVTGTARMESTVRGQDTRFRIRYIAVYVKAQERWQLVAWQSTRVPDA